MHNPGKFYLTTPIYYVNARPHLGHTYTTVVSDAICRRKRAQGYDTWFLTGTDEHGQKIERSAQLANRTPAEFAAGVSAQFRSLWDRMHLSYDDYIRTTEERHRRGVQKLFSTLKDKGFIYKGTYTGQYCVSDELYVDAPPGSPCPDCGRITETVSEENYFFKLSAFEQRLLAYYEEHPDFIRPEARRNEVLSFVRSGLKDLSISRTSFNWGIPVPGDEKHVIYVWMDALANYITAIGYGSDAPEDVARFQKYWPADIHMIGKEISRFHCVYWPAFLMAAGLELPKSIVAHGWLLFEQSKMSKSRGNIVRAETILEVLGADALRYFLMREVVFGQDGSFSFDALVQRYNSDLANGYGNLVSRTLTMIGKYFDGVLPAGKLEPRIQQAAEAAQSVFQDRFEALDFSRALEAVWAFVGTVDGYITEQAPWKLGAKIDDPPNRERLAGILATCAESLRIITALVYPVLPESTARIWQQLGLGEIQDAVKSGELTSLKWGSLKPGTKLGEVTPVFPRAEKDAIERMQDLEQNNNSNPVDNAKPAATPETSQVAETGKEAAPHISKLVSRLEGVAVAVAESTSSSAAAAAIGEALLGIPDEASAPAEPAAATPAVPEIPKITIDDFAKVELRVAQILVAERIPKADKLLRLEVDLGYEKRQILAGIAEAYEPASLVGRKVVIVANLLPRKMRGLESNGMIVAASLGEKGKPVLAGFLEDVEIGARLK
ncbi:MAG TPA: methionine--tRNA ligase [Acidisarcina sp.]|nr:methionine--tRNA ligase [Acidisarcina sp.]